MSIHVLIIDDTEGAESIRHKLISASDFTVDIQSNSTSALQLINKGGRVDVALVLWELRTGEYGAAQLVELFQRRSIRIPVIALIKQWNNARVSAARMVGSAESFYYEPFGVERVVKAIERACAAAQLSTSGSNILEKLRTKVIGDADTLISQLTRVAQVMPDHRINILILGERGTGKDLLAEAIHYADPRNADPRRSAHPYCPIDLTSLSPTLHESELFGHEANSFNNADEHKGWLETCGQGTVYLNEIGDVGDALQAKLREVCSGARTFQRVGGNKKLQFDGRMIFGTNRDLEQDKKKGRFRRDLYDRIAQCVVKLPPLRERKDDVERLIIHFLRDGFSVAPECKQFLSDFDYPGNVRQLEGILTVAKQACTQRGDNVIELCDLEFSLFEPETEMECLMYPQVLLEEKEASAVAHLRNIFYRRYLPRIYYEKAGRSVTRAAEIAGIAESSTFWVKWDAAGIPRPENRATRKKRREKRKD
jgi:DNA-binding NtrC family response regulator